MIGLVLRTHLLPLISSHTSDLREPEAELWHRLRLHLMLETGRTLGSALARRGSRLWHSDGDSYLHAVGSAFC